MELAWDDGVPAGDLEDQGWRYDRYELGEEVAWEAVRFDLEHPARIHGFSVMWTRVPAKEDRTLPAGLYGDFGYNGFDFWVPEPLWEGERCTRRSSSKGWCSARGRPKCPGDRRRRSPRCTAVSTRSNRQTPTCPRACGPRG